MPHSNFKQRSYENNTGFAKCSCGQRFDYSSPRDMQLKCKLHRKFLYKPTQRRPKNKLNPLLLWIIKLELLIGEGRSITRSIINIILSSIILYFYPMNSVIAIFSNLFHYFFELSLSVFHNNRRKVLFTFPFSSFVVLYP